MTKGPTKNPTPPRTRRGVIYDPIDPREFNHLSLTYCCEQCSHFDPASESCTIGYSAALHRRELQLKNYELSGRMAFCRYMEID